MTHPRSRTRISRPPLRIVVAGSFSSVPGHGGWTWVVLQYVLGLQRLGHRVFLVDPLRPEALRPRGATLAGSTNATYFCAMAEQSGFEEAPALFLTDDTRQTIGAPYSTIVRAAAGADLLINISGVLRDDGVLGAARRRVYLDLDPAFTQLWHTVAGIDMGFRHHTDFVTIGLAVGTPGCPVPTCGLPWLTTPQPIVLDRWPVAPDGADGALTTVANWRGYGAIEHEGVVYGQKAHAWRPFMPLPTMSDERFVPALAIDPGETRDLQVLAANGWKVIEPGRVASSPGTYQEFIRRSKAEFAVAKSGYVASRSGWFSDRSICYLASGRPVLAQDTGFGRFIPVGKGLLSFTTLDEALDTVDRLNRDYAGQARAARLLAERCFDSDTVLSDLLDRLGVGA